MAPCIRGSGSWGKGREWIEEPGLARKFPTIIRSTDEKYERTSLLLMKCHSPIDQHAYSRTVPRVPAYQGRVGRPPYLARRARCGRRATRATLPASSHHTAAT
jgi:hypothetical protein